MPGPAGILRAQEADSGFDVSATITGQGIYNQSLTDYPRDGSAVAPAFRAIVYPDWKIDEHWQLTVAVDMYTIPGFAGEYTEQGYHLRGDILQANLGYSRVSDRGSLVIRVGQMTPAFGSFPLRYDDAVNPLPTMPMQYGYYYSPVDIAGLAGAEVDASRGKWDVRVQFANSSPANPRSVFARDQYGNWEGGAGFTIRQGLRVGISGYRGPYLDRHYAYFFPGEANPDLLPATAVGVDAKWAIGHWDLYGEWQHFIMPYRAIPTFRQTAGYVETRRVLNPRWYLAGRAGYLDNSYKSNGDTYEAAVGFRPNANQILKFGYSVEWMSAKKKLAPTVEVQLVTTIHPISLAWR